MTSLYVGTFFNLAHKFYKSCLVAMCLCIGLTAHAQDITISDITGEAASIQGGQVDVPILGMNFCKSGGGTNLQGIVITFSNSTAGVFSNLRIFKSTNATFGPADTEMGTFTFVSGNSYSVSFANQTINNCADATHNYFVVADVNANIPTSTSIAASITASATTVTATNTPSSYSGSATGPTYNSGNVALVATLATNNAGLTSPVIAGTSNTAIFGFRARSNGTQDINNLVFTVTSSSAIASVLSNLVVKNDGANASYSGAGTAAGTAVVTGTGPYTVTVDLSATPIALSSSDKYFYLVADVPSTAPTTAGIQADLTTVGVSAGTASSLTGFSRTFNINALNATLATNNGALSGALTGGNTNAAIFGFSAQTSGSQSINNLVFTITSSSAVASVLSNLVVKDDGTNATYSGAGTAVGTAVVTGTGPYTVTVDLSATPVALSGSNKYFYLVADVPSAAPTTAGIQADLTTVGISAGTTSSLAGFSRSFNINALNATLNTNNAGLTSPLAGGNTNAAIFGFRAQTNGSQSINNIVFTVTSSAALASVLTNLILKDDGTNATYSGAGAALGTAVVTGTGPYTVTVDLSGSPVALSGTDKYFYLVADVPSSAPTTAGIQADLTTVGISVGTTSSLAGFSRTFNIDALNATIGTNNAGLNSPVSAGNSNTPIFGFRAQTNGSQSINNIVFTVTSSAALASVLTNLTLKDDGTNTAYSGAGSALGTAVITGTGPYTVTVDLSATPVALSGSYKYFYLVADLPSSAPTTTGIQVDLTTVGISAGTTSSLAGFSRTFDINALTSTLTQLTTGIAASPLAAGTAGSTSQNAIIGFTLVSSGSQTVSVIRVALNTDPTGKFTSYGLILSTDNSFSTTGDNSTVALSSSAVTGTGPYYVNLTPTAPINISTAKNLFMVVSVSGSVTTATGNIQPTLSTADITLSPSNITASSIGAAQTTSYAFVPSQLSTIALTGGTTATVDFSAYSVRTASSGLIWTASPNSTNLGTFTITDGGGATDNDSHGTTVTSVTITITNPGDLRTVAIFNGGTNASTNVGEQPIGTGTVTFTGLSLTAADGGTQAFTIRATWNSGVTDNASHDVTVTSVVTASASSQISPTGLSGAATSADNTTTVVATRVIFVNPLSLPPTGSYYQGPINVSPNTCVCTAANFDATVWATDANTNRDLDNNTAITLSISGGAPGSALTGTTAGNLVNGAVTFTNLSINLAGTNSLSAVSATLLDASPGNDTELTVIVTSLGVSITPASTLDLCYGGSFQTLSNIVISETDRADFSTGGYFMLKLPSGFVFDTSVNPTLSETGNEITFIALTNYYVGSDVVRIRYTVSGTTNSTLDAITIAGLKVRYPSSTATAGGNITVLDAGAVQVNNAESNAKNHGTLTASQASTTGYDFEVNEIPGQTDIQPEDIRFNVSTVAVLLDGATANPATTNDMFSGNGVSYSSGQSSYIFSPSAVGVGNNYVVTYTANAASGCQITITKTFEVYATPITGLLTEYCVNDTSNHSLSVDPARYNIATSYPVWNIGATYNIGNRVQYNNEAYSSLIAGNIGNVPASSPAAWQKIGYTFAGFSVYIPSFKSITSINNPASGTITITSPNHGFANGSSQNIQYYVYDNFWNIVFQIPYASYTLSNVTTNTFDISYMHPAAGTYPGAYTSYGGGIYIQSPQVTGVTNNGTTLTISTANHGLANGVTVRIFLNGLSDNGISTRVLDWYQVSNVQPNSFDITTKSTGFTGSFSGSGSVDIFTYRLSTTTPYNFTPADVSLLNSKFGSPTNIYVGFLVNNIACTITASNTCAPFVYTNVPVQMNQLPTLDFNILKTDYCVSSTAVTLTGNQTDGSFAGLGISDGGVNNATASFNPAAGGIVPETPFNITYTFTDNKGCTNSLAKPTTVHANPVVNAGTPKTICNADPVTGSTILGGTPTASNNSVTPSFQYSWLPVTNLDNPANSNPRANPTANTNYTVTVTDNNNCVNSASVFVTVNTPASVNPLGSASICSNSDVTLSTSGLIGGTASTAVWSTSGSGQFLDGLNAAENDYGQTNKYRPSTGLGSDISNGNVLLTLTTNDPDGAGPCPAATGTLPVSINPAPTAFAGTNIVYCAGNSIKIFGSAGGSASSFTWTENGQGSIVNPTLASTEYTPSAAELASGAVITFTLTTDDPAGACTATSDTSKITINRRAIILAGADFDRCEDETITLNGSVPAISAATSHLWTGGLGGFSDATVLNPQYIHDPTEVGQTVNLTITSNDPDGAGPCPAESAEVRVTIKNDPLPPGLDAPDPYCVGQPILDLTANGNAVRWYDNPSLAPLRGTGLSFSTGVLSNTDKKVYFYATQTFNGCESDPALDSIVVNPLPQPDFTFANVCDGDFTEFTGAGTLNYNNGGSGTITEWHWNFADSYNIEGAANASIPSGTNQATVDGVAVDITTGTFNEPDHQYQFIGNYNVQLRLTTSDNCTQSITKPVRIGPVPRTNFVYKDICESDTTDFTSSAGPLVPLAQIASWAWDFGDGNVSGAAHPPHIYTNYGTYPVTLTITTDLGCDSTITKSVPILPYIKSFPYQQSFEAANHGWVPEAHGFSPANKDMHSWLWTVPNYGQINSASEGTRAWITRVDSLDTYFNNERSVLNGPCIDVTALDRPVLSFDYWNSTDLGNDGAYMEVSTNGGLTWQILGTLNQGLNWYNRAAVLGLTKQFGVGQDAAQLGWSGKTTGWTSGKFSLDNLKTQNKLRIRFVFGSNPDNPTDVLDGFAVDNFKLNSRNRMLLVENFTNTAETVNNTNFVNFKSALNTTELIKLQYHTGLKGFDQINNENTVDPNARAAFYGLTNTNLSIPRGYIDGYSSGFFTTTALNWADNYFSLRSLATAPFNITVNTKPGNPGEIAVSASIVATEMMSKGTPILYFAVIEKSVGSNQFVVRKVLPSAAGYPLSMPIALNQLITSPDFIWSINNSNIDLADLAIIAFVQDITTKEVYQASVNWNPGNLPSLITGTETLFEKKIVVYPNPADEEVNILLPEPVKESTPLKMFDTFGKTVSSSTLAKGSNSKTIQVKDFAAGVYLIQLETPEGLVRKKVMVVHDH